MSTKSILLPCSGLLALGLLGTVFIKVSNRAAAPPSEASVLNSAKPQSGDHTHNLAVEQKSIRASQVSLQAALAETDPARRRELLGQWADSMATGMIEDFLASIESMTSPEMRSEIRQALLSSWTRRDLPGMAGWFGKRNAADEMHQEARELLTQTLAGRAPADGFSWMEKSLPEAVRQELYGSFFRQWANTDPTAAAAKLRQLAEMSPGVPVWNDLIGQVVAQWANTDLNRAVAWTKALPEGPDKARILVQLSYRWVESDPRAAATYASTQNAPDLLKVVVGKWAENDPRTAADWANGLPAGGERKGAIVSMAASWAQKDPQAAAAYVGGLSAEDAKTPAALAVVAVWANANPAEAAKWVAQMPEGAVRELALGQLMSAWTGSSAEGASQWLKKLPATHLRDAAVNAYCTVMDATDPVASFEWAKIISDEALRTQRIESAATAWAEMNPAMAP